MDKKDSPNSFVEYVNVLAGVSSRPLRTWRTGDDRQILALEQWLEETIQLQEVRKFKSLATHVHRGMSASRQARSSEHPESLHAVAAYNYRKAAEVAVRKGDPDKAHRLTTLSTLHDKRSGAVMVDPKTGAFRPRAAAPA